MASTEVISNFNVQFEVTLKLTLAEAKALKSMTGYGADSFLAGYYKQLGKSYLQPHEKAVRSLFTSINTHLPAQIRKADECIKAINTAIENFKP